MPASARRFIPHAVFALLLTAALAWSIPAAILAPLPDGPNDFNSPGFIVRHSWVKFGMLLSGPFRGELSEREKDAKVARYFELNRLVREQEQIAGNPDAPDADKAMARTSLVSLRAERADLENTVELILEGRLTRVIRQTGLTRQFGGDVVWPPVNIEFQNPPSVLVKMSR